MNYCREISNEKSMTDGVEQLQGSFRPPRANITRLDNQLEKTNTAKVKCLSWLQIVLQSFLSRRLLCLQPNLFAVVVLPLNFNLNFAEWSFKNFCLPAGDLDRLGMKYCIIKVKYVTRWVNNRLMAAHSSGNYYCMSPVKFLVLL